MTTSEGVLLDKSEHLDPFGGNSQVVTWTLGEVNLPQFNSELQAAFPGVQMVIYAKMSNSDDVLMGSAPVQMPVSAEAPLTIYLSPSTVDVERVKGLLGAHRPDPYFGMTPGQQALAQIRSKLASGQGLTQEEMTLAMQAVLNAT